MSKTQKFDINEFKRFLNAGKKRRAEIFEKEISEILSMDYNVDFQGRVVSGSVVWFLYHKKYGVIAYYPIANKIHIHKGNRWIKQGLTWVLYNIADWKFKK